MALEKISTPLEISMTLEKFSTPLEISMTLEKFSMALEKILNGIGKILNRIEKK